MDKYCTIHQHLSVQGVPLCQLSEVRIPTGQAIPGIKSITVEANAERREWLVTLTLTASFGEPILSPGSDPIRDVSRVPTQSDVENLARSILSARDG